MGPVRAGEDCSGDAPFPVNRGLGNVFGQGDCSKAAPANALLGTGAGLVGVTVGFAAGCALACWSGFLALCDFASFLPFGRAGEEAGAGAAAGRTGTAGGGASAGGVGALRKRERLGAAAGRAGEAEGAERSVGSWPVGAGPKS